MPEFVKVASKTELHGQSPICAEVGGKRIALFDLGGEIYAIDDVCTHEGGPLSEGLVENDEVECPWHGARFKIATGAQETPSDLLCCDPLNLAAEPAAGRDVLLVS